MNLAPVALFVFNRPVHTKLTIDALTKNEYASETEIFVFCDGPRSKADLPNVAATRQIVREAQGFKRIEVFEHKENQGLAKSVIFGITQIIERYGRIIVLEDDIVCHISFLKFMNEGLEYYKNEYKVYSITGYTMALKNLRNDNCDVYFTRRHSSWGWGTWLRCWQGIDWIVSDYQSFFYNKHARKSFSRGGEDLPWMLESQMSRKIDSWAIRFNYHCWKNNGLSVASITNLIENIGFDGSGRHCQPAGAFVLNYFKNKELSFRFTSYVKLDPAIESERFQLFRIRPRPRIFGLIKHLFRNLLSALTRHFRYTLP